MNTLMKENRMALYGDGEPLNFNFAFVISQPKKGYSFYDSLFRNLTSSV